jgi:tetratricopeptide (TPR) repeat protein
VRDVAYSQIPRARRAEKHRLAAEWIESLAADRSDDRVEMLAHHYGEALALARAAGVDIEHLRAPAKRAFADAAERALALNAWAASREFAKQALALSEPDDALRPDLQFLIAEAGTFLDEISKELMQEALDGFLARDDPERAAEAESMLSWMAFFSGENRGDHAERAVELVRDRPLSYSKARAYAQLARVESLAGRYDESIAHSREALQMAEELGNDRLAAHALNSVGMSRVYVGDDRGIDDMHESIKRAERANAVDDLTKGWNNLTNCLWSLGRLEEASRCWQAGYDASVRHGMTTSIVWLRGEAMLDHYLRGDLKNALRIAEALLTEDAPSSGYQIGPALGLRSKVFCARGRLAEALADSERALERARAVADPQQLFPATVDRVRAAAGAGKTDEANALLDELFNELGLSHDEWAADLTLLMTELGRQDDYLAVAARSPKDNAWREAATAAASGDLIKAAALFGTIGARYEEAYARLLAAERGAGIELEAAYAYFAEQELDVYIRRCEALLAASA